MTSEQVLHFSRLRLLLRNEGISVDIQRAWEDKIYLNEILVAAMNSTSPGLQESAYLLGASVGLANAGLMQTKRLDHSFAPEDLLPEITSEPAGESMMDRDDDSPAEPAAIGFQVERMAVMKKYIAGLR